MLRPSKLTIKGFRSFEEEATFEFKEGDFVLISGHSATGSQSGTGKSSVLMAMAFALGIKALPATELKNWRSKSLSVELTIVDGPQIYKITKLLPYIRSGSISLTGRSIGLNTGTPV